MNINPTVDYHGAGWRERRGDVIMFHEMTHAYHELRGTDDNSGIVTGPGLDGSMHDANLGNVQSWEHQAVGIGTHEHDTTPNENAYRAERARIGAHGGATVVPGDVGMPQRVDYRP